MKCPYCGGKTKILESRQQIERFKRRHECFECKKRFSTYEITKEKYDEIIKYKKIVKCLERLGLHLD